MKISFTIKATLQQTNSSQSRIEQEKSSFGESDLTGGARSPSIGRSDLTDLGICFRALRSASTLWCSTRWNGVSAKPSLQGKFVPSPPELLDP